MLKKMFRSDFRMIFGGTYILLLAAFCVAFLAAGILLMLENLTEQFALYAFSELLYALALLGALALGASCAFYAFIRFYRSLFSDEGYLTMVIPMDTHSLLLGKISATLLAVFLSVLAEIVVLGIAVAFPITHMVMSSGKVQNFISWQELFEELESLDINISREFIFSLITVIFAGVQYVMIILSAIVLGGTCFRKGKVIGALLFVYLMMTVNSGTPYLFFGVIRMSNHPVTLYMPYAIYYAVTAVALYFLSHIMVQKRFNLE